MKVQTELFDGCTVQNPTQGVGYIFCHMRRRHFSHAGTLGEKKKPLHPTPPPPPPLSK